MTKFITPDMFKTGVIFQGLYNHEKMGVLNDLQAELIDQSKIYPIVFVFRQLGFKGKHGVRLFDTIVFGIPSDNSKNDYTISTYEFKGLPRVQYNIYGLFERVPVSWLKPNFQNQFSVKNLFNESLTFIETDCMVRDRPPRKVFVKMDKNRIIPEKRYFITENAR